MIDLQVVKTRQLITPERVTQFEDVDDFGRPVLAPILDIRGSQLDFVEQIIINDVPATDFTISSPRQILVVVPTSVRGDFIRTVQLIAVGKPNPQLAKESGVKLLFNLGKAPVRVQGIQKLVQQFTIHLLTTPGTDLFDPTRGGGFLSKVGNTISLKDTSSLLIDLAQGVSRTQSQIIAKQTQNSSIPDDERLLSSRIVDSFF